MILQLNVGRPAESALRFLPCEGVRNFWNSVDFEVLFQVLSRVQLQLKCWSLPSKR